MDVKSAEFAAYFESLGKVHAKKMAMKRNGKMEFFDFYYCVQKFSV